MVCSQCGYNTPDGSNTCMNCGNYIGPNANAYEQNNQYQPNQWQYQQQYNQQVYYAQTLDDPTPLTTMQYVGMLFLQMIPIVGFIMILVWAFSKPGNINRRNYARGTLIAYAILIGAYIAILFIFLLITLSMSNMYRY